MPAEDIEAHPLDVLIIGGGPAGMSAALTVGRALLDTVIVNAETPRNLVTTASHGFLTRDGAHPSELLAVAKQQLGPYRTVEYRNDTVVAATATETGFEVALSAGEVLVSDRLVIATGQTDRLDRLGLAGIEEVYGTSVYPCIFCDGFEHRGERLALFGGDGAVHYAPMVRQWSPDLVVFTNGGTLSDHDTAEFARAGIQVVADPIRRLESTDGRLLAVELMTGESIERDAGFISDEYSEPASNFAESLGVASAMNDWGQKGLDVTETGGTSIAGLHVIGDARTGFSGLIAAAAEGAACAEMIVHEIAAERWTNR